MSDNQTGKGELEDNFTPLPHFTEKEAVDDDDARG